MVITVANMAEWKQYEAACDLYVAACAVDDDADILVSGYSYGLLKFHTNLK
jgi:hypothetical protein